MCLILSWAVIDSTCGRGNFVKETVLEKFDFTLLSFEKFGRITSSQEKFSVAPLSHEGFHRLTVLKPSRASSRSH